MILDPVALAVALAVLVGSVAQSVSGIGFVLVCGPVLVSVLGPREGVVLALALSVVTNVAVLAREWRAVRLGRAVLLLVPAALSTPLWVMILADVDGATATRLAGAAVVGGVLILALGLRWRAAEGAAGAVVCGVASSAMNALAAVGGPAVALYAANARWPAAAMRATLQAYFVGLNLVGLIALGPPEWEPALHIPALGGLAVGLGLGALAARRVSHEWARFATLALAGVSGAALVATG